MAGLLARVFAVVRDVLFLYVSPVLSVGARRPLVEDDLPALPPGAHTAAWHAAFERVWRRGSRLHTVLFAVRVGHSNCT